MPTRTVTAESRLLNRELSWVEFNARVLDLAAEETQPLLERVKFCSIFSSNLDEFFMVRVAGLMDQEAAGLAVRSADGLTPSQALAALKARVTELTSRQAKLWKRELRPALAAEGIEIVTIEECSPKELKRLEAVFTRDIYPVLTPLAVGAGQPFPYISGPLALAGRARRRPGQRRGAVRPRQGAGRARPVRRRRAAARAARVGDRALPALALPRDGDLRAGALPRHA